MFPDGVGGDVGSWPVVDVSSWLALIVWFVLDAAGSEARLLSLRYALEGLVVRGLTRLHPIAAHVDQTLRDFMAEVAWDDDSAAHPPLVDLRPVGILTSRRLAGTPKDEWATVRVRDSRVPLLSRTTLPWTRCSTSPGPAPCRSRSRVIRRSGA